MASEEAGINWMERVAQWDGWKDLADQGVELGIRRLSMLASKDEMLLELERGQQAAQSATLSEDTLRALHNWFADSPGSSDNIMWITGVPAELHIQDIVSLCQPHCLVAGHYSFSSRRGSEQVDEIVPTLAYRISCNVPSLRRAIGSAASYPPPPSAEGIDIQLKTLVFAPFMDYSPTREPDLPAILVIDSLELYHDVSIQRQLIWCIEAAATTSTLPLRFLFTSRHAPQDYPLPFHRSTHIRVDNDLRSPASGRRQSRFTFNGGRKEPALHGFPPLLRTPFSISEEESYFRCLMMLGHGIPLWRPKLIEGAPDAYHVHGPQIGDIVYIAQPTDILRYVANIFRPLDDPLNIGMGVEELYDPLVLDSSDVIKVKDYFKPGTVLTSANVVATKKSEHPLTVNFTSSADEGAFLVLPEGASREDLKSTQHLHKYVQKWAPIWYRRRDIPNGSLFLVTGSDKAADYACASFGRDSPHANTGDVDADYLKRDNFESPWSHCGRVTAHSYRPSQWGPTAGTESSERRLCVFIRGMRIAVSGAVWSSHHYEREVPRDQILYSSVVSRRSLLKTTADSVLRCLHLRKRDPDWDALVSLEGQNNPFHPIFILAPALFQKHPKASVVVINDSDWSALTDKGRGDWPAIKALFDTLFQHFKVVEDHGVISLSRKNDNHSEMVNGQRNSSDSNPFRWKDGKPKMIRATKFAHESADPEA